MQNNKATSQLPLMHKYAPSEKQINWAHKIIALEKKYKVEQFANSSLQCPHCQAEQAIKETTVIFNYYYEEPWGCTGGDNYIPVDGVDYICNSCKRLPSLPDGYSGYSDFYKATKYKVQGSSGLSDTRPR